MWGALTIFTFISLLVHINTSQATAYDDSACCGLGCVNVHEFPHTVVGIHGEVYEVIQQRQTIPTRWQRQLSYLERRHWFSLSMSKHHREGRILCVTIFNLLGTPLSNTIRISYIITPLPQRPPEQASDPDVGTG